MKEHDKSYDSLETMKRKFATFVQNHFLVHKLNEIHTGKTEFALNRFADLSPNEFKETVLMTRTQSTPPQQQPVFDKHHLAPVVVEDIDLPDSFDWRDLGAVTPIKDQGSVGTCWAFSATQNIEGQFKLKGNPLTNLSVEQIVDCDGTQDPDSGEKADCGVYGGWPFLAIEYVQRAV
jgi:cathepsin F